MLEHQNTHDVSVVIPTLGGESLRLTIEKLNQGTIVPKEILICIPKEESCRIENLSFPNVKVVSTECRGQVAQRAEGFNKASCKYVLQLDDDIVVDLRCLEYLVKFLESKTGKCAVSPSIRFIDTDKSVYSQQMNKFVGKIYYYLINGKAGYKPGTVTKAGTEIGVDPTHLNFVFIEVDWFPGGCVLHSRENLILNNFYPFSGKAYCEDLYHSLLLKNNAVKMFVHSNAIVWIESPQRQKISIRNSLKGIQIDYTVRQHYLRAVSKSLFWMHIYFILFVLAGLKRLVLKLGRKEVN